MWKLGIQLRSIIVTMVTSVHCALYDDVGHVRARMHLIDDQLSLVQLPKLVLN